jgi:hypothetical protein
MGKVKTARGAAASRGAAPDTVLILRNVSGLMLRDFAGSKSPHSHPLLQLSSVNAQERMQAAISIAAVLDVEAGCHLRSDIEQVLLINSGGGPNHTSSL